MTSMAASSSWRDTCSLQRPAFTAVSACLAALRSGGGELPDGVVALGNGVAGPVGD